MLLPFLLLLPRCCLIYHFRRSRRVHFEEESGKPKKSPTSKVPKICARTDCNSRGDKFSNSSRASCSRLLSRTSTRILRLNSPKQRVTVRSSMRTASSFTCFAPSIITATISPMAAQSLAAPSTSCTNLFSSSWIRGKCDTAADTSIRVAVLGGATAYSFPPTLIIVGSCNIVSATRCSGEGLVGLLLIRRYFYQILRSLNFRDGIE